MFISELGTDTIFLFNFMFISKAEGSVLDKIFKVRGTFITWRDYSCLRKVILKVPKREIFDRSDFPGFYTIKSLCVGDFGVKIKKILNNN